MPEKFCKVALLLFAGAFLTAALAPFAQWLRPALAQSRNGDAIRAQARTGPGSNGTAEVTGLRWYSDKDRTRVTLELSQETKFDVRELKENSAKGMPPRIYVDLASAKIALESKEPIAVDDGLLHQVRVGQYSAEVVRVVLDMNRQVAHNAFMLADPARLVIDVLGGRNASVSSARRAAPVPARSQGIELAKLKKPDPAPRTNALRKVVLDPGHGGKDPGAIGVGGIAEKDVVLSVAKKLARKLRNEMGVQVVLTRNDDRFVPLEDRTATANAEDADLFISLHMNASPNSDARGIETYYLDNTTDEAAIRLAARENSTSRRNISDLQFILSDMTQNMKLEDSITLAHRLHGSMVDGMAKSMGDVKDLGVKKALFYVLVGARMPSVLVEMFFITNRKEGRAMKQERYQDTLVESLYRGIQKFGESHMVAKTL